MGTSDKGVGHLDTNSCAHCGRDLPAGSATCFVCTSGATAVSGLVVLPDGTSIERELLEGKWLLDSQLGRGGMGTVYLAKDLELERQVAIKMLAPELAEDPDVVARFEREARILAKLEHPNLVPIFAVGRHANRPFIVMKKLEGMTLADYLRSHGSMSTDDVLYVTAQICAGLALMHARGIIHRDLKPGNIFLGRDGHVTILDLGVAYDTHRESTRAGMLVGTPRYMSPEQIRGKDGLDGRSDLYVLGAVVFEMATGQPPFPASNEMKVMQSHLKAEPPDASALVPSLPAAFSAVLRRALSKKPEDRHPSVEDFFTELSESLGRGGAFYLRRDFTPKPTGISEHEPRSSERSSPRHHASSGRGRPSPPSGGGDLAPSRIFKERLSTGLVPVVAAPQPAAAPSRSPTVISRPPRPLASAPSSTPPVPLEASWVESARSNLSSVVLMGASVMVGAGLVLLLWPGAVDTVRTALKNGSPVSAVSPPRMARGTSEADVAKGRGAILHAGSSPSGAAPSAERVSAPGVAQAGSSEVSATEVRVSATLAGEPSSARLDVDGTPIGTTPVTVQLGPGKHSLRLERDGLPAVTRIIEVEKGAEPMRVSVELEP